MAEMMGDRSIAYFTMEIALESNMPTYSGGLGVLAADTLRSAANLKLPMVGMTLLHRKGYFFQRLDANGRQLEEPVEWVVGDFLEELPATATVTIEGRTVYLRAWQYTITGFAGHQVPVYFLDADLPENDPGDRRLTDYLYGGDNRYRLCQEVILGIGGVRMLDALGHHNIDRFHMNEGHASLLTLELLKREAERRHASVITLQDIKAARRHCVFTTHTPVPAGHDEFHLSLVEQVLGSLSQSFAVGDDMLEDVLGDRNVLNMTHLALKLSRYINGVAKRHAEVSRSMFSGYSIDAITNGVDVPTWTSPPFQELFDRHIPGWREDNFSLRYALSIPKQEVWEAHQQAKRALISYINREANVGFDIDHFTIGFARRATTYKRADLVFEDVERLKHIAAQEGPFQLVFAGKAHPRDGGAKDIIQRVFQARDALRGAVPVVYLENYDLALARLIVPGVDLWLNNPLPPNEASGTSGMKAALNGVPSLSVLDGWWIEGHIEGVTGWSIGEDGREHDAASLYDKLEKVILPLFYKDRDGFINVMQHAIALNGSFFTTQRMLLQYVLKAYWSTA